MRSLIWRWFTCSLLALPSGLAIWWPVLPGAALQGQTIPQATYRQGQPTKLTEAPSQYGTVVLEVMVRGLNMPHSAVWVPLRSIRKNFVDPYNQFSGNRGGAWLISEQKGGLWVLFQDTLYPLQDLPPDVEQLGEGGYLDLRYSPLLGQIFLSYAKKLSAAMSTLAVVLFTLQYGDQGFRMVGQQEIFQAQPPLRRPIGYGGSLSITQEYLYIGLGSRGQPASSQDIQSHWGTVNKIPLRQHQAAVTQNQVFPGAVSYLAAELKDRPSFSSQMVSLGHGDIQAMFWDPFHQHIWLVEQLRRADGTVLKDELNLLGEGRNYGWGVTESLQKLQKAKNRRQLEIDGTADTLKFAKPGFLGRMRELELSWKQSYGWSSILVLPPLNSGQKNLFAPWAGEILLCSLQGQSLFRFGTKPSPTRESGLRLVLREQLLNSYLGPLRWIGLGPDGAIYLLAYSHQASGARMLRLSPKSRMFAN